MNNVEIERKYLVDLAKLPFSLDSLNVRIIEQGYLCTAPVVRIRRDNDKYELTYKSGGMMKRREENLPLNKEAYEHLKEKVDGRLICKKRYMIPLKSPINPLLSMLQLLQIHLLTIHIPVSYFLLPSTLFYSDLAVFAMNKY